MEEVACKACKSSMKNFLQVDSNLKSNNTMLGQPVVYVSLLDKTYLFKQGIVNNFTAVARFNSIYISFPIHLEIRFLY